MAFQNSGVHLLPIDVQDKKYKAEVYEATLVMHSERHSISNYLVPDVNVAYDLVNYYKSTGALIVFNKAPKKSWGKLFKEVRKHLSTVGAHVVVIKQNTLIETEEDYECIDQFSKDMEDTDIYIVIEEKINSPHLDRAEISHNEVIRTRVLNEYISDNWGYYKDLSDYTYVPVQTVDSRMQFLDTSYYPRVQMLYPDIWNKVPERTKRLITFNVQMTDGFLPLLRDKVYDDDKFMDIINRRLNNEKYTVSNN